MNSFKKIKEEYQSLKRKLSQPGLSFDKKEYAKISKRFSFLQEIIGKIEETEKIEKNIKENKIIGEKDNELASLAIEELPELEKKRDKLREEIEKYFDNTKEKGKEALIEIRGGAGGDEASLFAKNLFEMYQKFSQKMGWNLTVLNKRENDIKGIKEISFEIKGKDAPELLLYESGVHRVQRIPETEKMGRIHTSTVSVSVLKKPKDEEVEINPQDLRVDVYRSSGPGGQYVNKRDSAVRITHIPTGIVASSQNARTQISNRETALSMLKTRLYEEREREKEEKIGNSKKNQIGRLMRAEKIRTYNFPQDRITDHRIKKSWGNIENVLDGNLEKIIETLKKADK